MDVTALINDLESRGNSAMGERRSTQLPFTQGFLARGRPRGLKVK